MSILLFIGFFSFGLNIASATLPTIAPSSNNVAIYRTLQIGSRGSEVKALQQFLKDEGYYTGRVDGVYGKKTARLVKTFQDDYDLPLTGVVDSATLAMINQVANDNGDDTTTPPIVKENPCKLRPDLDMCQNNTNLPVISGVSGPQNLNVNQQGTWTVKASSKNNSNLSYSVSWGDEYNYTTEYGYNVIPKVPDQQSATFNHTYSRAGTYTATFTVSSSNTINCITTPCPTNGGTAQTSITVKVGNTDTNTLSILTPSSLPNAKVGVPYTVSFEANDIGTKYYKYNWRLISNLSPYYAFKDIRWGNKCDGTVCGPFTGVPVQSGTYSFTLVVTAGSQKTTKEFTLVVDPATSNDNVVTIRPTNRIKNYIPGQREVTLAEFKFTGSSGTNETFSIGSFWPYMADANGNYYQYAASNPTHFRNFSLWVDGVNKAQTYSADSNGVINFSGVDFLLTSYRSVTMTLKADVVSDASSAKYRFALTGYGYGSAKIDYYDSTNMAFSGADSEVKISGTTNTSLSITNTSFPNAKVGTSYPVSYGTLHVLPDSMPTQQLNWKIISGSLPNGMYLSASDVGEIITGTPTIAGSYTFTLQVYNSSNYQSDSKQFTLVVDPEVIEIKTLSVNSPRGGETWTKGTSQTISWYDLYGGNSYDIKLVPYYPPCNTYACPMIAYRMPYTLATNVYSSYYIWNVGQNTDSPSLVLDGSYTVQVCRTGTSVCGESSSYFKIISSTTSTLSFTTQSPLPNAKVGSYYSAMFYASGLTDPSVGSTFTLASGSFPPGINHEANVNCNTLSCVGSIGGTPTTAGTYTFSVLLTETTGRSATKQFTLTVDPIIINPSPNASITINGEESPSAVISNTLVTVAWTSNSASSCYVYQGDGSYAGTLMWQGLSGSKSVNITSYTRFRIWCYGAPGTDTAFDQVSIDALDGISIPPPMPGLEGSALNAFNSAIQQNTAPAVNNSSFKFTQFLEQGSYGVEVQELQKVLAKAGYYTGAIDSVFGSGLKSAVIKFQIANGLKADGLVGYEMRTFLNK